MRPVPRFFLCGRVGASSRLLRGGGVAAAASGRACGGGLAEAARRDRGFGRAGRRRSRDRVVRFFGDAVARSPPRVCYESRRGCGTWLGKDQFALTSWGYEVFWVAITFILLVG